jgi:hypothetical protein
MVEKWWTDSDIFSTINSIKKQHTGSHDLSVINDFFANVFNRDDINKIPFSLDHAVDLIGLIKALIESKYEYFRKNGLLSGINILRNISEKIFSIKNSQLTDKEDKNKKCQDVAEKFSEIFKNNKFTSLCQKNDSPEIKSLANTLYTDLEFFLKSFKKM